MIPSAKNIRELAEIYGASMGTTARVISRRRFGDFYALDQFAAGERDIGWQKCKALLQWFSDNWPVDVAWPDHIDRLPPAPRDPDEPIPRSNPNKRKGVSA